MSALGRLVYILFCHDLVDCARASMLGLISADVSGGRGRCLLTNRDAHSRQLNMPYALRLWMDVTILSQVRQYCMRNTWCHDRRPRRGVCCAELQAPDMHAQLDGTKQKLAQTCLCVTIQNWLCARTGVSRHPLRSC